MRVFIAGPMSSSGEPGPNVHAAATAAAELLIAGHLPFVPHVTWFLHMVRPDVDVALWREWDLAWLRTCDCLLRLTGVSRGADVEVEKAHELGIPVYTSIESLIDHSQDKLGATDDAMNKIRALSKELEGLYNDLCEGLSRKSRHVLSGRVESCF